MTTTPTPTYDAFSRLLHALLALLILLEFGVALLMPDVHRGTTETGLLSVHVALGTSILALALLRVVWSLLRKPPAPVPGPALQMLAARWVHRALLFGFALLPVLGWINAGFRGWDVRLAGLLPLPALAPQGAYWANLAGDLHGLLGWGLLALIGLHVLATLYHQLLLGDDILARISLRRRS